MKGWLLMRMKPIYSFVYDPDLVRMAVFPTVVSLPVAITPPSKKKRKVDTTTQHQTSDSESASQEKDKPRTVVLSSDVTTLVPLFFSYF